MIPEKNSRQKIWDSAREMGEFTIKALGKHANHPDKSTIRKFVYGWEKAGFVKKTSNKPATYKVVDSGLVAAPAVNPSGVEFDREQAQEQMWRTMFIIKEFSALDLAVAASTEECVIKEKYVKSYVSILKSAGYLKFKGKGRYIAMQSKFTGPRPPAMKRVVQVVDRNTGKIVFQGGMGADNE